MHAKFVLAAIAGGALGMTSLSAQPVVQTVQDFVVGQQPDGWSFPFQISRWLPTSSTDVLVKVTLTLSVSNDYPSFTATSSENGSVAQWDVAETVTVKNLHFNVDDGCDDDQDPNAVKELEIGTEFSGVSSPLANGASQTVPETAKTAVQPTVVLTSPDDLKRFTGDPNSPKALNIKIVNKQARSFIFKPGDGTFTPARSDYHPVTTAELVVTYYVSTTSSLATCESGYDVNAAYLAKPANCRYSCSSHN
jgi:hypothetical protein